MKNALHKKRGVWYYRLRNHEGKVHWFNTKQTDRQLAVAVVREAGLDRLALAAQAGRLTQEAVTVLTIGRRMTVAQAVEDWAQWKASTHQSAVTVHNERLCLLAWMEHSRIGHLPPSEICAKHISAYVNQPDGTKASSRKVRLSSIRSFLDYCVAAGYRSGNPGKLVRVDLHNLQHEQKESRAQSVFEDAEIDLLLQVAAEKADLFWTYAITFGRDTGLRLGDLAQMQWASFGQIGRLKVWTDKTDAPVWLDITGPMRAALARIQHQDATYLFPDQAACVRNPRLRARLSVQFRRLLEAARIERPGLSFHSLRHTYITRAREAGLPLAHIAKSVGHASPEMTAHYVYQAKAEQAH